MYVVVRARRHAMYCIFSTLRRHWEGIESFEALETLGNDMNRTSASTVLFAMEEQRDKNARCVVRVHYTANWRERFCAPGARVTANLNFCFLSSGDQSIKKLRFVTFFKDNAID